MPNLRFSLAGQFREESSLMPGTSRDWPRLRPRGMAATSTTVQAIVVQMQSKEGKIIIFGCFHHFHLSLLMVVSNEVPQYPIISLCQLYLIQETFTKYRKLMYAIRYSSKHPNQVLIISLYIETLESPYLHGFSPSHVVS